MQDSEIGRSVPNGQESTGDYVHYIQDSRHFMELFELFRNNAILIHFTNDWESDKRVFQRMYQEFGFSFPIFCIPSTLVPELAEMPDVLLSSADVALFRGKDLEYASGLPHSEDLISMLASIFSALEDPERHAKGGESPGGMQRVPQA